MSGIVGHCLLTAHSSQFPTSQTAGLFVVTVVQSWAVLATPVHHPTKRCPELSVTIWRLLDANSDFLYGMATVKRDSQSAFTTTLTLPANGKPRLGEIQVKQSLPASAEIED